MLKEAVSDPADERVTVSASLLELVRV